MSISGRAYHWYGSKSSAFPVEYHYWYCERGTHGYFDVSQVSLRKRDEYGKSSGRHEDFPIAIIPVSPGCSSTLLHSKGCYVTKSHGLSSSCLGTALATTRAQWILSYSTFIDNSTNILACICLGAVQRKTIFFINAGQERIISHQSRVRFSYMTERVFIAISFQHGRMRIPV